MPEISQRTLGKVITALTAMGPDEAYTFSEVRDFWRTKLFEREFPSWLIDFVLGKHMNWSVVIPELFEATVKARKHGGIGYFEYEIGRTVCHAMLPKLTLMAFEESKEQSLREAIRLSLQLDGFEVSQDKLRLIDGPVSAEEEKSRLLAFLRASKLGRQDVISRHLADAADLFSQGKYHPAIGEARSGLQAIIEETVVLVEAKVGRRSGGGTKNQVEFLEREKLFSTDDQQAFLSAWAFLSSGNHPGLSSEEEGRIGTILCLEFSQILLIKGKALL
jgi:hypothetical protein